MKNCDEMVSSLLRRRAEYEENRKKQRKTMLRLSGAVCSLALVAFIGAGVYSGWWLASEPELPTVTPTRMTAEPTEAQPTVEPTVLLTQPIVTAPPATEPVEENHIVINEIESVSGARMYISLMCDDFVPMTESELTDYFGISIFPEVPEDLGEEWSMAEGIPFGIYRRDGGTGEVYHDQQVLNWSTEDFSRWINIELRKGGLPFQCFRVVTAKFENSVINGQDVFLGRTDDGLYLAEFMYKDVGFRIVAEGLTQEELVDVIESLVTK